MATGAEVDAAVQCAASAFRLWADVPPPRRARVMSVFRSFSIRTLKRIARALSEEHGKTLPDAEAEVGARHRSGGVACGAPQLLKGEFSDSVGTGVDSYSLRQPLGVVAGIRRSIFRRWCRCGCSARPCLRKRLRIEALELIRPSPSCSPNY